MKTKFVAGMALLLACSPAWTQDSDDDTEATIRLMGAAEAELPEAVTKTIALPESLKEDVAAIERARQGLDRANDARGNREQGQARAEEARERGAEMSEAASENRENRGRSDDANGPPDNPGPPVDPGPP